MEVVHSSVCNGDVRKVELEVTKNEKQVDHLEIGSKQGFVVFGRKKGKCDIVLQHNSISKRHGAIVTRCRDGGVALVDFGSSNGTKVNGKSIEPNVAVTLHTGDVIMFGLSARRYLVKITDETAALGKDQSTMTREERVAAIKAITESMLKAPPTYTPPVESTTSASYSVETEKEQVLEKEQFPIQGSVVLESREKPITSITIDRAGARFAVSATDFLVKFYDFGGMTSDHEPFCETTPIENHVINRVRFSPSGNSLLVIPAHSQAFIYSRDGKQILKTAKGDPYLHDMAKTKGHPSIISDGAWRPLSGNNSSSSKANVSFFLTSGLDGTCRIWDVENGKRTLMDKDLICSAVLKARNERNTKIQVNSCTFDEMNGMRMACGCSDGSIQLWDWRQAGMNSYNKPDEIIRPAHQPGGEITCVRFSPNDENVLASRGEDGSVGLFDLRKSSQPVKRWACCDNLPNTMSTSNLCFSPDGKYIVSGETRIGDIVFIDSSTGSIHKRHRLEGQVKGTVCVEWHPVLNQLLVGCRDGSVHILFDPASPVRKGVMLTRGKTKKTKREYYTNVTEPSMPRKEDIFLPNALPMFRKDFPDKRKQSKKQQQQLHPQLPEPGTTTATDAGSAMNRRIPKGTASDQYRKIVQEALGDQIGKKADPREELLKHADSSDSLDFGLKRAYGKTQPGNQLASMTQEEEEETLAKKLKSS